MKRLSGTRQSHTLQITCLICIIKQVNLIIPTGTGSAELFSPKERHGKKPSAGIRQTSGRLIFAGMKKIGIISDTHGIFDTALKGFLADVDEIWHAGDIGSATLSDEIAAFKPLRAVYGNIDDAQTRRIWPETGVFRMRGNHRTDDAHRRLSRPVRPLLPAPYRIVPTRHRHNGPLAHSESDVRPPARRTAHQSRCCGQIRVPQSPDSHPARSRRPVPIGSLEVGEWKK